MSDNKAINSISELKTTGVLVENGVIITEKNSADVLSQRGYGTLENEVFKLAFYEALYLLDRELLIVRGEKKKVANFQRLLRFYEKENANAWVNYLVYRDLRSRGYVVREGFGFRTDFRIYDRGAYGKDSASYLVLVTQEGKPLAIDDLIGALRHSRSQKKELVLAVMNRRGEIVYYSVSSLSF